MKNTMMAARRDPLSLSSQCSVSAPRALLWWRGSVSTWTSLHVVMDTMDSNAIYECERCECVLGCARRMMVTSQRSDINLLLNLARFLDDKKFLYTICRISKSLKSCNFHICSNFKMFTQHLKIKLQSLQSSITLQMLNLFGWMLFYKIANSTCD